MVTGIPNFPPQGVGTVYSSATSARNPRWEVFSVQTKQSKQRCCRRNCSTLQIGTTKMKEKKRKSAAWPESRWLDKEKKHIAKSHPSSKLKKGYGWMNSSDIHISKCILNVNGTLTDCFNWISHLQFQLSVHLFEFFVDGFLCFLRPCQNRISQPRTAVKGTEN